jgi:hypothetical protein
VFEFNLPVAAIPADYREFLPSPTTPAIDELIQIYSQGKLEMRRLHAELMGKDNRGALQSFAYGAQSYYQSENKSRFWAMDFMAMFDLQRAINARQEKFWFELFDLICNLAHGSSNYVVVHSAVRHRKVCSESNSGNRR